MCLYAQSQSSDKVDSSNYYKYKDDADNLNWLRSSDVIPIIIDELLKNGIPYYSISIGDLIKINDSTRFVLTVSFEKNKEQYGFLYEAVHGLHLTRKDRDVLNERGKSSYVQAEQNTKGSANFMRIDPLPTNIMLLSERCYWFQFDRQGTKYPVSKEVIENILRQDIQTYLLRL